MAHTPGPRDPRKTTQGGKEHLEKLFEDVERTVKPYPPLDLKTELSWKRETPKGQTVRTIGYTSAGLLIGLALFGMITHDREILFAVLDIVKYSVFGLLAWALGKAVMSLLLRSTKHDGDDDETQNTG